MNKTGRTIVLANGEFPTSELPLGYLNSADMIICCDGAVDKLVKYGLKPDAIVGDMDSISDELRRVFSDIMVEDKIDQDTNDLTKAIRYCVEKEIDDVVILGATGLREDHTLANISLLLEYIDFVKVKIVSNYGIWLPLTSSAEISSWKGQRISIFTNKPEIKISSEGLRYPLNEMSLENWWMGSLNECLGSTFRLDFTAGKVILFLKFN